MAKLIIKRLLTTIPMLILISMLIFVGLEFTPGDPLSYMVSPDMVASGAINKEEFRRLMGLDQPLFLRYLRWMWEILHGNLGYSIVSGTSISTLLKDRLPATLELAAAALAVSSLTGLVLGLIASVRQNSFYDYAATIGSIIGMSVPEFFMGLIAIMIFALKLKWFPSGGRLVYGEVGLLARLSHLVMPAMILGISLTAGLTRYTRGAMLDVLSREYVKTARSKGLPEWKVIIVHAFRNALTPVILLLCFRLPILISGTVIIEQVFSWPGMGVILLSAITGKDYPVVMIFSMLISFMILFASFLVDVLTALLDPRVRFE